MVKRVRLGFVLFPPRIALIALAAAVIRNVRIDVFGRQNLEPVFNVVAGIGAEGGLIVHPRFYGLAQPGSEGPDGLRSL